MNLQELEARLQSLIEVDLLNLLPGRNVEDVVVQQLAAAIRFNAEPQEDGSIIAPNVFTLIVHPAKAEKWQDRQLLAILLHSIASAAQEAGFRVTISPTLTIATDETLPLNDARVLASHRIEAMSETNANPLDTNAPEEQNKMPENAFLIVEGVKVFPLKTPVINIGRRLDNQLVIDDPRVSRNHAQLRAIKGRFVIFDLNSTGGTFVNGQRASQTVLYPGDVISLAGVALIFGQDNPPPRPDLKETAPYSQAATERPTAILSTDHSTAKLKRK
ncbi:MAG: FHA domain-containing protein [Chloroflexi bacterium]|nr:FHA domain-containing protein [Chloroflexota bacterium]MCA2000403.1 FHA domain-containing protein [Chloroflexota bacterium]